MSRPVLMSKDLSWLSDGLDDLDAQGLLRKRRQVKPLADGSCEVDGRRVRDFASNNYLNLAHDSRLIEAAKSALDAGGVGARASALVVGRTDWHAKLEERLAEFEGAEAAILFPTGYAANQGALTSLIGNDDVIYSDRLNHASLIDGCRLSKAKLKIYRHNDVEQLKQELQKSDEYLRRWIVTDSLFSMDGDVARLPELCDLAERYDACLLIDEAHATGVFGEKGRGVAEWQGVEERIAVRVGTLSKGIGTAGGFVAGSRQLINWLWNRARTQIYSTALPPSVCAAACAAIEIIEQEPERRERLLGLSALLRQRIKEVGLTSVENSVGPIVPVILGEPETALEVASHLEEAGFLVGCIRPPTVPNGTSRLRISLCCAHTEEDIEQFVEVLMDVLSTRVDLDEL